MIVVPEDEAEETHEAEIVAELNLDGQIMRKLLEAGESWTPKECDNDGNVIDTFSHDNVRM